MSVNRVCQYLGQLKTFLSLILTLVKEYKNSTEKDSMNIVCFNIYITENMCTHL